MPISGNEEVEVKPPSNFDIAGVPLKKRTLLRLATPPPEEENLVPTKNDSLQNEQGNQLQESSPLEDSRLSRSPDSSNPTKDAVPEGTKRSDKHVVETTTDNHSVVKIGEPSAAVQSDYLVKSVNEEKLGVLGKHTDILIKVEKVDQNVPPDVPFALKFSKEMSGQLTVETKGTTMSTLFENPDLSLGLNQNHASTLKGYENQGSHQNRKNLELVSLNLSLSDGKKSYEHQMNDGQSDSSMTNLSIDRSNWDLNTTMDTWEGSMSEGAGMDIHSRKELFKENVCKPSVAATCLQSSKQYDMQDSLNLCLSPNLISFVQNEEASHSSANRGSHRVTSDINLPRVSVNSANAVCSTEVKSEPLDESHKQDFRGAEAQPVGSLGLREVVKHKSADVCGQEAPKPSSSSAFRLTGSGSIKSEAFDDGIPEVVKRTEVVFNHAAKEVAYSQGTVSQPVSLMDKQAVHCQDTAGQVSSSSDKQVLPNQYTTEQPSGSAGKRVLQGKDIEEESSCLVDGHVLHSQDSGVKSSWGNSSDRVDARCTEEGNVCEEMPTELYECSRTLSTEMVPSLPSHCKNEVDVSHEVVSTIVGDENAEDPVANEHNLDLDCNRASHMSDDEKINLSGDMLEDDPYESDFDSNGNSLPMDIEESYQQRDEYEDGEVRERERRTAVDDDIGKERKEICTYDSDNRVCVSMMLPDDDHLPSDVKDADGKGESLVMNNDIVEGNTDVPLDGRANNDLDNDASVKASSDIDMSTSRPEEKMVVGQGIELSSDQITCGGDNALMTTAIPSEENAKTDVTDKNDSEPKLEPSSNDNNAAKHNRSRIIDLSRASSSLLHGKLQSLSGTERERLLDVPLEGNKFHYRGRDEIHDGVRHKFFTERTQDHSYRNPRLSFGRGRWGISNRFESLHGGRDSEHGFSPEPYNASSDFFSSKRKYGSVMDQDADFIKYNIGPDNAFVGNIRRGRKMISDDDTNFRQYAPRRRSPGGRDGSAARDIHMVRRAPRNITEEGSEVVGLRRPQKMFRKFSDDGSGQMYARVQPPYGGLDGRFVKGRNFSSDQRRALHSKSPIRSQSPGPWSFPRRRSPDGFGGRSDVPLHRSPPIYRMERMGSPNPGSPGELMRRHGSPPYFSRQNDMREVDSCRDHSHSRSLDANRSPANRVSHRKNSRRFGILDPQERNNGDGFFEGHTSRFHDLGEDGNTEDRRRFGEIRGPARSFRPLFNRSDNENFHNNSDEGPRHFRYFPDFHGRTSVRERDFNRRVKHRPEDVHRRSRTIEDLEGNYRHGGQGGAYDGNYDDTSRMKRKRF